MEIKSSVRGPRGPKNYIFQQIMEDLAICMFPDSSKWNFDYDNHTSFGSSCEKFHRSPDWYPWMVVEFSGSSCLEILTQFTRSQDFLLMFKIIGPESDHCLALQVTD